jgi:hypothetical protein
VTKVSRKPVAPKKPERRLADRRPQARRAFEQKAAAPARPVAAPTRAAAALAKAASRAKSDDSDDNNWSEF